MINRLVRQMAWLLGLLTCAWAIGGCASAPTPQDYAAQTPVLNLRQYFDGELLAHGLFSDRPGKVQRRFSVAMSPPGRPKGESLNAKHEGTPVTARWVGAAGTLTERFTYSDGQTETRIWHLVDHGQGRYSGRADDVVGEALGQAAGNALNWRYTLRLPLGGSVVEVDFDDWMVLMNERVLLNKAELRKFGIRLGEVTIAFQRL